jgi:hypothetical protein
MRVGQRARQERQRPTRAPCRLPLTQVRTVATKQFFARARRLKTAVQQQQLPSILTMSGLPMGPQQLVATYNHPGAPRPTGAAPMLSNPLGSSR